MSISFSDIVMRRCTNVMCGYSVFMVSLSPGGDQDVCPQCSARLVSAGLSDMREILDPVPADTSHHEGDAAPLSR